jgi:TonB family protein
MDSPPRLGAAPGDEFWPAGAARLLSAEMMRALLVFALAFPLPAFAQSAAPQGSLAGVVLDAATQRPIEGATVTAKGAQLVGEQSVTTDANGFFEITMLPTGIYELTLSREGYATFEPGGLDIKNRRVRVKLSLEAQQAAPARRASSKRSEAKVPAAPDFDAATMTPPAMLSGPAPEYTPQAIEQEVEGTMVLRCVVLADGSVRGCVVKQGLPFMNRACVDALEARRYKPATRNGKPIDVNYTFTIRLELPSADPDWRR